MLNVIFSIAILLLMRLFVGLGLLKGRKYVPYFSTLRIVATLIALPLSVLLSVLAARGLSTLALSILRKMDFARDYVAILEEIPTVGEASVALCAVILSPVLFYPIFLILRLILNVIAKAITKRIAKKKRSKQAETEEAEEPRRRRRRNALIRAKGVNPRGMLGGAICGFLLFMALISPAVGFMGAVNEVVAVVAGYVDEPAAVGVIADGFDDVANSVGAKGVRMLGGKLLYDSLASARVGGERMVLSREIDCVCAAVQAAGDLSDDAVSHEQAATSLRGVADAVDRSVLVPAIATDVITAANGSWSLGEDFHGLEKPELGENLDPLMDDILATLSTTTNETFRKDARSLVEVAAILAENGLLENVGESLPEAIGQTRVTEPIFCILLSNGHIRPLVGSMMDVGVAFLVEELHAPQSHEELYRRFLSDGEELLRGATGEDDLREALLSRYCTLFDIYALDVTEESIEAISRESERRILENTCGEGTFAEILSCCTLTDRDGERFCLSGSEELAKHSLLAVGSDIHFQTDAIADDEVSREAASLASVLSNLAKLLEAVQHSKDSSETIRTLGPVLDSLSSSETVGAENTKRLVTVLLQSESVRDQLGCSVLEATEVVDALGDHAEVEGYGPLMSSLGDTVEVIGDTVKDGSDDLLSGNMEEILSTLTPGSASVLQAAAKPSIMIRQGVPERSAEASAEMFSVMLGNLSDARESEMSDEEYEREAHASAELAEMALKMGTSSADRMFGEDSVTGDSAEDFLDKILESEVASATVVETVYGKNGEITCDPLNTERELSEEERREVLAILNDRWANADEADRADGEYEKRFVAIGAMMNMELTVTEDGIVPVE